MLHLEQFKRELQSIQDKFERNQNRYAANPSVFLNNPHDIFRSDLKHHFKIFFELAGPEAKKIYHSGARAFHADIQQQRDWRFQSTVLLAADKITRINAILNDNGALFKILSAASEPARNTTKPINQKLLDLLISEQLLESRDVKEVRSHRRLNYHTKHTKVFEPASGKYYFMPVNERITYLIRLHLYNYLENAPNRALGYQQAYRELICSDLDEVLSAFLEGVYMYVPTDSHWEQFSWVIKQLKEVGALTYRPELDKSLVDVELAPLTSKIIKLYDITFHGVDLGRFVDRTQEILLTDSDGNPSQYFNRSKYNLLSKLFEKDSQESKDIILQYGLPKDFLSRIEEKYPGNLVERLNEIYINGPNTRPTYIQYFLRCPSSDETKFNNNPVVLKYITKFSKEFQDDMDRRILIAYGISLLIIMRLAWLGELSGISGMLLSYYSTMFLIPPAIGYVNWLSRKALGHLANQHETPMIEPDWLDKMPYSLRDLIYPFMQLCHQPRDAFYPIRLALGTTALITAIVANQIEKLSYMIFTPITLVYCQLFNLYFDIPDAINFLLHAVHDNVISMKSSIIDWWKKPRHTSNNKPSVRSDNALQIVCFKTFTPQYAHKNNSEESNSDVNVSKNSPSAQQSNRFTN
jgi:hypothetical protein